MACTTLDEVQNHVMGKAPTKMERIGHTENHLKVGQNGLQMGKNNSKTTKIVVITR